MPGQHELACRWAGILASQPGPACAPLHRRRYRRRPRYYYYSFIRRLSRTQISGPQSMLAKARAGPVATALLLQYVSQVTDRRLGHTVLQFMSSRACLRKGMMEPGALPCHSSSSQKLVSRSSTCVCVCVWVWVGVSGMGARG